MLLIDTHQAPAAISGAYKEEAKADIEETFRPKNAAHIQKLRAAFPGQVIFGCSDVMDVIDLKSSRASELLKEMAEQGVIEPVSGHGKGKYRFGVHT